ncbi:Tn554-related, transposase A [Alkaliphilus metalliredigens QYMF]|uniref:Tn554-related, transposase A n=1 Tax=Alkaliphilus metalliredigens (strain QYMF) TaxID=293826 RepID=A6TT67_ALKMQ|nr:transposase [Alkaliphilus metalliredigens]ABR49385.1 Tn554-related, transposase A [Alkaliphilus metalliredigens QYMF]
MKVQQVIIENTKVRYILIDDKGEPVIPAIKYLKYIDNTGRSINTQKTYCYALKLYFYFLKEQNKIYSEVTLNDLGTFVG